MRIVLILVMVVVGGVAQTLDLAGYESVPAKDGVLLMRTSIQVTALRHYSFNWKNEVVEISVPNLKSDKDGIHFQAQVWQGETSLEVGLKISSEVLHARGDQACIVQSVSMCLSLVAPILEANKVDGQRFSDRMVLRKVDFDWSSKTVKSFVFEIRRYSESGSGQPLSLGSRYF